MSFSNQDWGTLLTKLRSGLCTPFIGAGASFPSIPLGGGLAEKLLEEEAANRKAEKLLAARANGPNEAPTSEQDAAAPDEDELVCPVPLRSHLEKVAEYLAVARDDQSYPKLKIADFINRQKPPDFENDLTEPHRVLSEFPLPIYLTTNYDDFMFRALSRKVPKLDVKREFARWSRNLLSVPSEFDKAYQPTWASPVVFHLHGHAGHHPSIVASEDDYLDFMVNSAKDLASTSSSQPTVLPLPIRTAIVNSTLLFVGYGLSDINFRVLLRGIVGALERNARQLQVAVQMDEANEVSVRRYMEKYFDFTFDLKIFWGTAREFATDLRRRM